MSKLDSYPPGFQNRALTSVYKRFVTGAHKGKTGQRTSPKAAQNALKTGGTKTMPNHTMKFVEPARRAACAGVIAQSLQGLPQESSKINA